MRKCLKISSSFQTKIFKRREHQIEQHILYKQTIIQLPFLFANQRSETEK